MRILVMGTGGVGGYFGALLARAGHELTTIARGAHLDALRANGLRIETAIEDDFTVPVIAVEKPQVGYTPDLVLVAVKSYDLDAAIETFSPAVGGNTTVLTLLNGVESGERLAEVFGPERVLDGVVYIESFVKEPGVIAQVGGPRKAVFGNRHDANGERERGLHETFVAAGWNIELADNIVGGLWAKFSYLGPYAAFNTVTALTSAELCSAPECEDLMRRMVAEYIAVGNAEGAALPETAVEVTLGHYRRPIVGMTSMFRDRAAGKRIEAEALVGAVVRRGARAGIPTPVAQTLYAMLKPMMEGGSPIRMG